MKQNNAKKNIKANTTDPLYSDRAILDYVDILVEKINAKLDSIIEMVGAIAEDVFSIKSWIKEHEQVTHRSIEFRLSSIESTNKNIETSK